LNRYFSYAHARLALESSGEVNNICIIIYDVTDVAINSQALNATNKQLEYLSRTDRLTELNNRGFWEECLQQEFARFQRHQLPTSLVIFDIDHFKKVNDTFGHQAGDEVIRRCAQSLSKSARDTNICGRYGGEEFYVGIVHQANNNLSEIKRHPWNKTTQLE